MTELKKKSKRILTLFTAAATILSAVSLTAFAANEYDYTLTQTDPDTLYGNVSVDLDSDYTSAEFISALKEAGTDNAFLAVFDEPGFPNPEQKKNTGIINAKNGDKTVSITKDMADVDLGESLESFRYQWGYWYITAENKSERLVLRGTTDIPFTYRFSKVYGGEKNEYVTSLGVSIRTKDEIEVVATYASLKEEEEQTATVTIPSNTEYVGYFFGLKAPADYCIKSIVFTAKTAVGWPYIDDMCFITSEVEAPPSVITDLKINGEKEIATPPYKTVNTYTYTVDVFDQYGEKMPDEEVELAMTSPVSNPSVSLADGVLTIRQSSSVPDVIELTATPVNKPELAETLEIKITGTPYYNEDLIGVTNGNPEYDMTQFKEDLAQAATTEGKDMTIFNFDSVDSVISGSKIYMPLERSGKTFTIERSGANIETRSSSVEWKEQSVTPSGGDTMSLLLPVSSGENKYGFVADDLGKLRVTKLGLVIMSYRPMSTKDGFYIDATFSDGTTQRYSSDISGGGSASGNTFFGIKAPAGHYITQLDIETVPKTWSAFDELGVILEEPDILTLETAYEKFMFSTVTGQDMKNIRENLNLYTLTPEGATIEWESDKESVINPLTGAVTLPDIAENSNVKLTANIKYGVLTKARRFNVYVPNKLELDANALVLPQTVSQNLVLPKVGSMQNSTITWTSDNEALITKDGVVTRPEGRDGYVVLKATLSNDSGSIEKTFEISVSGTIRDKEPGGGGGGGGGGSTVSSKTPVQAPPIAMQRENTSSFSDVGTAHWAYSSIIKLSGKGIVNGTGENKFEPEGNVTREQFVSMLVRAMEFKSDNSDLAFSDVAIDSWYKEAISVAADMGIVSGRSDGSFGVGENITREDMAVMAYRALRAAGKEPKENQGVIWADDDAISDYAKDAISLLKKSGIINGMTENEFSPKSTSTRAQAATIICRMLEGV